MGIVVEIDRCKATFSDPGTLDIGFNLAQVFGYPMHSFEIQYGVRFDPDPDAGIGRDPKTEENWRLGIIQNVLLERLLFVYEDAEKKRPSQNLEKAFMLPEVDIVPKSTAYPFYGDQNVQPGKSLITRPVAEITYSSRGYRETGSKSSAFDNSPSTFNMWDQPGGGAPLTKDGTFRLRRLEKQLIFQSWLVAIKTGEFPTGNPTLDRLRDLFIPAIIRSGVSVVALASIPPFATTFWADFDLAGFRPKNSIDTPDFTWGLYGSEGYFPTKKVDRSITSLGPRPDVRAVIGDGQRSPVASGASALEGVTLWLKSVGLDL